MPGSSCRRARASPAGTRAERDRIELPVRGRLGETAQALELDLRQALHRPGGRQPVGAGKGRDGRAVDLELEAELGLQPLPHPGRGRHAGALAEQRPDGRLEGRAEAHRPAAGKALLEPADDRVAGAQRGEALAVDVHRQQPGRVPLDSLGAAAR